MNRITMEVDINGQEFTLIYDIPDAVGEISPTDLNVKWLDEHVQVALRPVLGKLQAVTTIKVRKTITRPVKESAQRI